MTDRSPVSIQNELIGARDRVLNVLSQLDGLMSVVNASPADQERVLSLVDALVDKKRALSANEELVIDGLVTNRVAAEFLGISTATLEKLRNNGSIRYCRLGGERLGDAERGGAIRFPRRELVRYAAENLTGGWKIDAGRREPEPPTPEPRRPWRTGRF